MDGRPAVELRNVTKSFVAGRRALDDVSFVVPEGKLLALVGTSGSGKTTALRSINRLVVPESGSVLVSGTDVSTVDSVGCVVESATCPAVGLFPHLTVAPT